MGMKKKVPDWLIGLIVTLFFLFITFTGIFDFTDALEMKSFDFRARMAAPGDKNPDIELVTITDDDLSELGRFPWPRNVLAQGINNLALAGAKVIAMNILFTEPEESAGLKAVTHLKERYEKSGLGQQGAGLAFYKELFILRGGFNELFLEDREKGLTLGTCFNLKISGNVMLNAGYAYQYFEHLSNVNRYSLTIVF